MSGSRGNTPACQEVQRPGSLWELFVALSLLALQGFGGIIAVAQLELVERRRWLTRDEFLLEWGAAQAMPGPGIVNLCLILGTRYFGVIGAITAVCGLMAAPLCLILALALLYSRFGEDAQVAGALRGMGAVAAGVIAATAIRLMGSLRRHPLGVPACAAVGLLIFVCVAILHLPLAWVLFTVAPLVCLLTYRVLAARGK